MSNGTPNQAKSSVFDGRDLPHVNWVTIDGNSDDFQAISFAKNKLLDLLSIGDSLSNPYSQVIFSFNNAGTADDPDYKVIATLSNGPSANQVSGRFPCPRECSVYYDKLVKDKILAIPFSVNFQTVHILKVLSKENSTHLIIRLFTPDHPTIRLQVGIYPGRLTEDVEFEQFKDVAGYVFKE